MLSVLDAAADRAPLGWESEVDGLLDRAEQLLESEPDPILALRGQAAVAQPAARCGRIGRATGLVEIAERSPWAFDTEAMIIECAAAIGDPTWRDSIIHRIIGEMWLAQPIGLSELCAALRPSGTGRRRREDGGTHR
ncbi:hypothetical protein SAMN04487818_110245 [Actinokineospora terrae]|uniref:Uncharacterized protein n=1 Tax=Actinokineospora terrae TaxID=155974 RepID=A0A1H9WIL1_9PSEU|nr:hypothetical protein SAMN04487818_110245 [Actinokineospora terrae]